MSFLGPITLPNELHPADELAWIGATVRKLKLRESELRQEFLTGRATPAGDRFEAVVREQRRRTFLRDRLPRKILDNPD